jgi:hypothetical protein
LHKERQRIQELEEILRQTKQINWLKNLNRAIFSYLQSIELE